MGAPPNSQAATENSRRRSAGSIRPARRKTAAQPSIRGRNWRGCFPRCRPGNTESLRESIRHHGVGVPSIWDEAGNFIDGANRERACEELGITCPREIREFASAAEKLELAVSLNIVRRHLNRSQKRRTDSGVPGLNPKLNDRHLGDLVKVSKNTVASKRREMEATGQIDQLSRRLGRDGKLRPARYRRIIANTPREAEMAREAIRNLPASCEGKILDATSAARCQETHHETEVGGGGHHADEGR